VPFNILLLRTTLMVQPQAETGLPDKNPETVWKELNGMKKALFDLVSEFGTGVWNRTIRPPDWCAP
jgi:hypothetical protein